jgi:predicted dehydrogenase
VSPHDFEFGTGETPITPAEGLDAYRSFGSKGSLSFPDMAKWTYSGKRSWSELLVYKHVELPDIKIPFELHVKHFVRVIKGEVELNCSGVDGLRAVTVWKLVGNYIANGCLVDIPIRP